MAPLGAGWRVLVDRYELREQVGRGGMGEVWLGWDSRLQRDVAVKLLLAQLSAEPSFRRRFEVEASAAAALDHPNVVDVYDIDDDDGALFIVMERLPGPSLDRHLADGPMAGDDVSRLAADLLAGLAAAHAAHLVHRDVKPGNLIRSAGGRWKLGDFGVAKDLASAASLTLVGVAVGTPAYLAPEQLDGRPASAATDLWAAAVVIREALTGRRPFEGDDPVTVAHAVRSQPLAPLVQVRPDADPALAAALDRALAFDPAARFASAVEMLAAIQGRAPAVPSPSWSAPVAAVPALGSVAGPAPAEVRTRRPWAAVAVAAAAAVATGLVVLLVALALSAWVLSDDDGEQGPAATAPPPGSSATTSTAAADAPTGASGGVEGVPQKPTDSTTTEPAGPGGDDPGDAGGGDDPPTTGAGSTEDPAGG